MKFDKKPRIPEPSNPQHIWIAKEYGRDVYDLMYQRWKEDTRFTPKVTFNATLLEDLFSWEHTPEGRDYWQNIDQHYGIR